MINLSREWVENKIKQLKLQPSRGNGQNFLINKDVLDTIVEAGEVAEGDRVLEIGPGLGALTETLLEAGAHVTAIEYDPKLATFLRKALPQKFPHEIVDGDALSVTTPEFLKNLGQYKIIANIPYHITSALVRHFTENQNPPITMCLLVQKEVAERIVAKPPDMSMLALFTQWYADVKYIATVPRNNFIPAPEVDSAIVQITPRTKLEVARGLSPEEQRAVFSTIKQGFAHPRKQLANNLGIKKTDTDFDLTRRAETLTIEEWITLSKSLSRT